MRKSLINTRKLLPIDRVNELDGKCLEYLLRLEGDNLREKAQKNKMRILGLTKEETYNLLENRVLKDFLERCITKVNQYQHEEAEFAQQHKILTNREQRNTLNNFKKRCTDMANNAPLTSVHRQTTLPKPNFVLQKDHDYKQIWSMYLDLIREKRALDQSLLCQQNLFQDICEILINTALWHLSLSQSPQFKLKALRKAHLYVGLEQHNGHRLKAGNAAVPFLLQGKQEKFVIEMVSLGSEQTSLTQNILRQLQAQADNKLLATAPCYLMLTKVKSFRQYSNPQHVVIPILTVHCLAHPQKISPLQTELLKLIANSAQDTLNIIPYLLLSTLDDPSSHFSTLSQSGTMKAYFSHIHIMPQHWLNSLSHIEHTLSSIFQEVLNGNR